MYRLLPVTIEHLPWLRLLFSKWHIEQPSAYPTMDEYELDQFVLYISRRCADPTFLCTIAFIGHRAVGFICAEKCFRLIGKPHDYVRGHYLYIIPKHRGRGLCQLLLTNLIEFMAPIPDLDLGEGVGYRDLWAAHGFTPVTTEYHTTATELAAKLIRRPRKVS